MQSKIAIGLLSFLVRIDSTPEDIQTAISETCTS